MKRSAVTISLLAVFAVALLFPYGKQPIAVQDPLDVRALEGRWEGTIQRDGSRWSADYAVEIFGVEPEKRTVMYRRFCSYCEPPGMFYRAARLKDDPAGISFETTDREPVYYTMNGNKLTGSWTTTGERILRYDYFLRRAKEPAKSGPKDLVGRWVLRTKGRNEIIISSVDEAKKTFAGKYLADNGAEYVLTSARIEQDGDRVRAEFRVGAAGNRFRMTCFPALDSAPPVIWGKVEKTSGDSSFLMYMKEAIKN